jgi:hypothetical protein
MSAQIKVVVTQSNVIDGDQIYGVGSSLPQIESLANDLASNFDFAKVYNLLLMVSVHGPNILITLENPQPPDDAK